LPEVAVDRSNMDIKIFIVYIGSLLGISIILLLVVKVLADGFASQGKKPVLYGAIGALIASALAWLSSWLTDNLFIVYWLLFLVFFVFGIVHVKLVQHKYFYYNNDNKSKVFMGELVFGLSIMLFVIVVFSSLQYFVTKNQGFIFYPMMFSTLGFFIPTMFLKTFEAAYNIPSAEYPTWEYPIYNPIDLPPDDPREKLLVIGFEIAKKNTDAKRTYFRAKAPEMIRLGELYYHFLNDYNDVQSETPIQYVDNGSIPQEWWFRLKKKWWHRNRILDPQRSVRENGIVENSVIICERINR